MPETDTAAQIYLIVRADAPAAAEVLSAAMAAAPAVTVLLTSAQGDRLQASALAPLVALAQGRGIATLVADDAALARAVGADGVHLSWSEDVVARLAEARAKLGAGAIVGAEAGGSRHDAMSLGEMGADYVAFALPDALPDDDAAELRLDMVAWWSEVFEVPCVAFDVTGADAAADLADAGADFIALTVPTDVAGAGEAVRAVATALAATRGGQEDEA
jgi:thiamine-phosphate pyrophosphorylase